MGQHAQHRPRHHPELAVLHLVIEAQPGLVNADVAVLALVLEDVLHPVLRLLLVLPVLREVGEADQAFHPLTLDLGRPPGLAGPRRKRALVVRLGLGEEPHPGHAGDGVVATDKALAQILAHLLKHPTAGHDLARLHQHQSGGIRSGRTVRGGIGHGRPGECNA